MDEPFASVDAQTREDREDLLLTIRAEFGMSSWSHMTSTGGLPRRSGRHSVLVADGCARELGRGPAPSPRSQLDTKSLSSFTDARAHVYRSVKNTNLEMTRRCQGHHSG